MVLGTLNLFAQQLPQISIPFLVYDNAGGNKTLYFGLDQTASDSLDPQLGESDLPPLPPVGAFDARFILPINNFNGSLSSWYDYRNAPSFPYSGTKEHRLRYQSAAGATVFYFSWNFPPEVTGLLQDVINGTFVNAQLSGSGVYELTDFVAINQLKLIITYNNIVTSVVNNQELPEEFKLEQNYPNPFNPITSISFTLPESQDVKLNIYNSLGQKIIELLNSRLNAGHHIYEWNAEDFASGVYFYEVKTQNYNSFKKMILLK
jgi:hypothetical protein